MAFLKVVVKFKIIFKTNIICTIYSVTSLSRITQSPEKTEDENDSSNEGEESFTKIGKDGKLNII